VIAIDGYAAEVLATPPPPPGTVRYIYRDAKRALLTAAISTATGAIGRMLTLTGMRNTE
jgi:hypothetical protein